MHAPVPYDQDHEQSPAGVAHPPQYSAVPERSRLFIRELIGYEVQEVSGGTDDEGDEQDRAPGVYQRGQVQVEAPRWSCGWARRGRARRNERERGRWTPRQGRQLYAVGRPSVDRPLGVIAPCILQDVMAVVTFDSEW